MPLLDVAPAHFAHIYELVLQTFGEKNGTHFLEIVALAESFEIIVTARCHRICVSAKPKLSGDVMPADISCVLFCFCFFYNFARPQLILAVPLHQSARLRADRRPNSRPTCDEVPARLGRDPGSWFRV